MSLFVMYGHYILEVEPSAQEVAQWNHPSNFACHAPDKAYAIFVRGRLNAKIKATPIVKWGRKATGLFFCSSHLIAIYPASI